MGFPFLKPYSLNYPTKLIFLGFLDGFDRIFWVDLIHEHPYGKHKVVQSKSKFYSS